MPERPVRPRDAASLVLVRRAAGGHEVLMGQRHRGHAFMPNAFVFPGGRVDPTDARVPPATPLRADVSARLAHGSSVARARALGIAAVRETYEETGLMLAKPAPVAARAVPPVWRGFLDQGRGPALDELDAFLRAITPTDSPIRFHARFFLAFADHIEGDLGGSGELEGLGWYPFREALAMPLSDITEFVLRQAIGLIERPDCRRPTRGVPLCRYRNEVFYSAGV